MLEEVAVDLKEVSGNFWRREILPYFSEFGFSQEDLKFRIESGSKGGKVFFGPKIMGVLKNFNPSCANGKNTVCLEKDHIEIFPCDESGQSWYREVTDLLERSLVFLAERKKEEIMRTKRMIQNEIGNSLGSKEFPNFVLKKSAGFYYDEKAMEKAGKESPEKLLGLNFSRVLVVKTRVFYKKGFYNIDILFNPVFIIISSDEFLKLAYALDEARRFISPFSDYVRSEMEIRSRESNHEGRIHLYPVPKIISSKNFYEMTQKMEVVSQLIRSLNTLKHDVSDRLL